MSLSLLLNFMSQIWTLCNFHPRCTLKLKHAINYLCWSVSKYLVCLFSLQLWNVILLNLKLQVFKLDKPAVYVDQFIVWAFLGDVTSFFGFLFIHLFSKLVIVLSHWQARHLLNGHLIRASFHYLKLLRAIYFDAVEKSHYLQFINSIANHMLRFYIKIELKG